MSLINFWFMGAGLLSFGAFSFLSRAGVEPFHNFYLILACWSYIFFIDGAVYSLRKNSLIISRTAEFLILLTLSALIFSLFELLNLRLQLWNYSMLPYDEKLRHSFYFLFFAAAATAFFETTEFLETFKLFSGLKLKPLPLEDRIIFFLPYPGLIFIIAALLFPRYFFYLAWPGLILIADPLNYRLGLTSLIRKAKGGNWNFILNLSAGSLFFGIMMEMWNYASGARLEYSLPFAAAPKIFELPLAGYAAFPLTAMACYSLINLFSFLRNGVTWQRDSQTPLTLIKNIPNSRYLSYIIIIIIIPIIYALTVGLIDAHSVKILVLLSY